MAIKELQTRIALKYDSYSAWFDTSVAGEGANLVLLAGELGICEIPSANADSNVAPTVLFKVGDGKKTFKELPWASAKAADVYDWAKASDVVYNQTAKTITFVKGNADGTDKVFTLNYVTEDEVTRITNQLASRLSDVEAALGLEGGGEGSVSEQLEDLNGRLETLEGDEKTEGSVSKALKDAKDYTDTREAAIKTAYEKYADDAEKAAKDYADEKLEDVNAAIADLQAADEAINKKLGTGFSETNTVAKAIADEATARENADKAINDKIGGNFTAESTVAAAIIDAKAAGTDAQAAVSALTAEGGAVAVNAANIAQNAADIAAEAKTREDADKALGARIDAIDAFFEGAARDKEVEGNLQNALDTLVEIQNYITGDGAPVQGMLDTLDDHEARIVDLEDTVFGREAADGVSAIVGLVETAEDHGERIAAAEGEIDALQGDVETLRGDVEGLQGDVDDLKAVTSGYAGNKAIKDDVDAAKAQAKAAQDDIDALELVVGDNNSGLVKLANDTAADLAALTGTTGRIAVAEGKIEANEGAIADLRTLTGANGAIRTEIAAAKKAGDDAAAAVEALAAGQVKTNKDDIGTLNGKVAAIEADYLKAADVFVFNCGSATEVVHEAPAN